MRHELELIHYRYRDVNGEEVPTRVAVEGTSDDLTEAWRELLSRLPNDVYQALKLAMPPTAKDAGTVRVNVTADTSAFEEQLSRMERQARRIGRVLTEEG